MSSVFRLSIYCCDVRELGIGFVKEICEVRFRRLCMEGLGISVLYCFRVSIFLFLVNFRDKFSGVRVGLRKIYFWF